VNGDARRFGAVEAGGTKFRCAIGDASGRIHHEIQFPTSDPSTTLERTLAFLRHGNAEAGGLVSIGVASFGPVELNHRSNGYGCIRHTPKAGWSGVDIVGPIAQAFTCPVGFDTDVNAAALAEYRWGAARDVQTLVYVTVGTGIGGGALLYGKPLHGLMHPEIGHIYPRRHPRDIDFPGVCPFHRDCLEGLASGPAIIARSGAQLHELDPHHPQWNIEADYLGQLCANLVLTVSPERIVLGGGVMSQERLFPMIRQRLGHWLGGYIDRADLGPAVDRYVVMPGLGEQAGIKGALALAIERDAH
jgi:fructokinase